MTPAALPIRSDWAIRDIPVAAYYNLHWNNALQNTQKSDMVFGIYYCRKPGN